ncbi:MAG: ZIP family metal transporter [Alistipes senegalensis]|nr:ZIP family metal transporter [Oxalobacter formigenes]MCM1280845.1 ZIP family metal transporter [Alistipes senegalensis]
MGRRPQGLGIADKEESVKILPGRDDIERREPISADLLKEGWQEVLLRHFRSHWILSFCMAVSILAVVVMLFQSLMKIGQPGFDQALRLALAGGLAGGAMTAAGAVPALLLRKIPQQAEDTMLGFAAGMMLAASAFSLLLPGLKAGVEMTGSKMASAGIVTAGMALGVLLMLSLDQFTPHRHEATGAFGPGHERFNRVWLFVFAISLHNLPEGMAIGVSFSRGDMNVGLPLTMAIVLQDIPEGLAVALALRSAGMPRLRAVLLAAATGLLEPLGSLLGVGLTSGFAASYPLGLGLAGGAMIFIVSHEVIPETHRNGHQTPATIGLLAGFALMMVLDTMLG